MDRISGKNCSARRVSEDRAHKLGRWYRAEGCHPSMAVTLDKPDLRIGRLT